MIKKYKITQIITFIFLSISTSNAAIDQSNSDSYLTFEAFLNGQNVYVEEIVKADEKYIQKYISLINFAKNKDQILHIFKTEAKINSEFIYHQFTHTLTRLNVISKDVKKNKDLLIKELQILFPFKNKSNDAIEATKKDETEYVIAKEENEIILTCLCADNATCENEETSTNCSRSKKTVPEKLVPIVGLGGIAFAQSDEASQPVYDGTKRIYNESTANSWISNSEYKLVNLAGDTALMTEYEDIVVNRPGYINKGVFLLHQGLQDSPHPYTQLGVNDAYAYGLSGSGITISVMDTDLCYSTESGTYSNDAFDHYDLRNKTVTTYGTYTVPDYISAAQWNASSQGHGCHVATTALGSYNSTDKPSDTANVPSYQWWDSNYGGGISSQSIDLPTSMMGVAYNASLHFADVQPNANDGVGTVILCNGDDATNCYGPQHLELATEDAIANGAKVQNNSWGWSNNDTSAETIAAYGSGSNYNRLAEWLSQSESANFTETQVSDWIEAYNNFQKTGVIVWANSNDNNYNMSTVWGGTSNVVDADANLPALFPELAEAWIAVTNVGTYNDGSKVLFSAPCATAAEYCLSHDGMDITAGSDVYDGVTGYSHWITTNTGTSMATPQISGAVAILFEAFPDNSPELITKRLLLTADNSWFASSKCFVDNNGNQTIDNDEFSNSCGGYEGEVTYNGITHAYNSLYGHGNPDLHLALQPIGVNTISGLNRNKELLVASSLLLTSYYGDALSLSGEKAIFRDQLNGGFWFDMGNLVSKSPQNKLKRKLESNDFENWNSVNNHDDNYQLSFSYSENDTNDNNLNDDIGLYSSFSKNGSKTYLGYNYPTSKALGISGSNNAISILNRHNQNSLLGFASNLTDNIVVGNSIDINEQLNLNFVVYDGDENINQLNERGYIASVKSHINAYDDITLFLGKNYENEGLLRSKATGAFGELSGDTFYTGAVLNKHLYGNTHLAGLFSLGNVNASQNENGLINNIDNITTSQFNLGLVSSSILEKGDMITFNISQPLRTESGEALIHLPGYLDSNNDILFTSKKLDLEPSGREINFDLGYENKLNFGGAYKVGSQIAFEPSHNNNNSSEQLFYGVYKINF